MQLDEYVTLHVRAENESEARGRAQGMAMVMMPGEFAVQLLGPEGKDLWLVNVYPAPKNL